MTPYFAEHVTTYGAPPARQRPVSAMAAIHGRALRMAERACCCPARPVVVAVLPPAPDRDHPTDLMLCAHHYRAAREALAAFGAAVFDQDGQQLVPGGPGRPGR